MQSAYYCDNIFRTAVICCPHVSGDWIFGWKLGLAYFWHRLIVKGPSSYEACMLKMVKVILWVMFFWLLPVFAVIGCQAKNQDAPPRLVLCLAFERFLSLSCTRILVGGAVARAAVRCSLFSLFAVIECLIENQGAFLSCLVSCPCMENPIAQHEQVNCQGYMWVMLLQGAAVGCSHYSQ